jgi:hypothetical protein
MPLSAGIATDDRQNLAGDVAGATGGREKNKGGRDLFRLRWALNRGVATKLRYILGIEIGGIERGPHRSRRYGVETQGRGFLMLRKLFVRTTPDDAAAHPGPLLTHTAPHVRPSRAWAPLGSPGPLLPLSANSFTDVTEPLSPADVDEASGDLLGGAKFGDEKC